MSKSLLLSYGILAFTCLSCLFSPPYDFFFLASLAVTLLYAIFGALQTAINECDWLQTLPDDDRDWYIELTKYRQYSGVLLPLLALPFLTASMWINQDFLPTQISVLHTAIAVGSSLLAVFHEITRDTVDILVAFNSASLIFIGVSNKNISSIYADIFFMIAHFWTFHLHRNEEGHTQIEDLYQYFLAAFIYFALKAVNQRVTNCIKIEIEPVEEKVQKPPALELFNLNYTLPNYFDYYRDFLNATKLKEYFLHYLGMTSETLCKRIKESKCTG